MTEEQVFLAALDLPDATSRAAYLDEQCGADAGLRGQVEALLASHFKSGDFMDVPAPVQIDVEPSFNHAVTIQSDVMPAQSYPEPDSEGMKFLDPSSRPDSLGRIGHYEVLQVLGAGGFGIVLRAFDDVLERVVAVKVMAPQLAATSPARKRFLREARTSAQVRHDNVVQVYEVGEQPLPYLVMEFIPGETLQQRLDRIGPLDVPEVLRIGRQIAEGLAAAHATDLIHRDIKPGNVLLEGGQLKVKITDFGLARAADDASMTQSGQIVGTPMYMAPEQVLGHTLDQRADLFSLGTVMYQMVSGRVPFRAPSSIAVLKRVAEDTPRSIREIIPETPQWLCDIIAKLHAKNPDERFQSAREVADVLADCEAQLKANSKLKDFSRIPRGRRSTSGPRSWIAAAAALLLPVLALALTEFAGVTHLFRGQQAKVDTTTLGTETPPVAKNGLSATSSAIGPIATPEPPADFREVHGVERAAFDIWLGEMKKAKYVPQTLAAWNTEKGDGRFAAVAIRDSQVIDWDVVYLVGPIADLQPGRLELLSKTGFQPVARAMNLSASAIQTTDLWIKYPSNRPYTIFRGSLQLLNTRLAECRANSMRPTYLCVTPGAKALWSFGHIYSSDDGLKWEVEVQINKANLLKELNDYRAKNWRLDCLAVYGEGIQSQFLVEFVENREKVEWSASLDLSTAEYEQELGNHRKLGMCPRQVSAREFGGTTRYSVIWQRTGGKPIIPAAPVAKQEPLPPTFKNSIGMEFVIVPKGKSWLGGGKDKLGDKEVEIPADFYLGKYEVTQEEWEKVMGENPSGFSRMGDSKDAVKDITDAELKRFPVENMTWDQCQILVAKLNKLEKETGWVYRLPKEAEWEYACRGGPMADKTDSAFDFYFTAPTNTQLPDQANFDNGNGLNRTCKVGSYQPNRLGLLDMHGNVAEWCDDSIASGKRIRGGCWVDLAAKCRASVNNLNFAASGRINKIGLRLARVPAGTPLPAAKTQPLAANVLTDAVLLMNFEKDTFYEKDGQTYVRDLSGRGNDGLCENVEFTPDGKAGGGLLCKAGQLQLAKSFIRGQPNYTIAAWCHFDEPDSDRNPYLYLATSPKNLTQSSFMICIPPERCCYVHAWNADLPGWWKGAATNNKAIPAGWFFVAVSLTGGETGKGKLRIVIDDKTYSLTSQVATGGSSHVDLIGHKMTGAVIDELAVFQRALSDQEIMAVRALGLKGTPLHVGKTPPVAVAPFTDADVKRIAALPAAEQVEEVRKELMRRNPGLAGTPRHKIVDGVVTELNFNPSNDQNAVTDLSPVRALAGLTSLNLWNCSALADLGPLQGLPLTRLIVSSLHVSNQVRDLKPLQGMRLTELQLYHCQVQDLKPLQGMPLTRLTLFSRQVGDLGPLKGLPLTSLSLSNCTQIQDFTPLAGMPLTSLSLDDCQVRDLEQLKGMKLTELRLSGSHVRDLELLRGMPLKILSLLRTGVTDLKPLQGMELQEIYLTPKNITQGLDILRDMKSLQTIGIDNGVNQRWPAAEFWERLGKGEFRSSSAAAAPFTDADVQRISTLPAAEQIEEVRKELMRLNPGFDGKLEHKIEGDVVTEMKVLTDEVVNIAPVRALTGLVYLDCRGTYRDKGKLSDLSPLKGMTISRLDCSSTQVSDLTPLVGLPLTFLHFNHNPVSEITPLKGMPLLELGLAETRVSDLSPLKGMKLQILGAQLLSVTDLTPLEGMPLKNLDLYHTTGVTNLQPLQSMPLETLNLQDVPVSDLSALQGMRSLRNLNLVGTGISGLTPLQGLKLSNLSIRDQQVSDLSPLQGMPLVRLEIDGTGVSDLTPLQGMPLQEIRLTPQKITQGLDILRAMKSLKTIGIGPGADAWPAAEFWDRLDKGEFGTSRVSSDHDTWLKARALVPLDQHAAELAAKLKERLPGFEDAMLRTIPSMAADRQAIMVAAWLRDRNPAFEGEVTHRIEGGRLTSLEVPSPLVQDLMPLRALPALRTLTGRGTLGYDNKAQSDAAILRSLKTLETINGQPVAEFWKDAEDRQAEFQEWLRLVPTLPLPQQVAAVVARLKERNPGLDGTAGHKIELGVVTELSFNGVKGQNAVTDLSPVRALPGLISLAFWGCGGLQDLEPLKGMKLTGLFIGSFHDNNQVRDLEPLAGMKLTALRIYLCQVQDLEPLKDMPLARLTLLSRQARDCKALAGLPLTSLDLAYCTQIQDFTPLAGLPLTSLTLNDCQVRDLEPIKGMRLTELFLSGTRIRDLELLKGMPLKKLSLHRTGVADLQPLQGLVLEEIYLTPRNITQGLDILRAMKSLKTIGIDYNQAWPAAEFWERLDKGEFK